MTVQYFKANDVPYRLIRVDLDPPQPLCDVLESSGWVEKLSLRRIALFYGEELGWAMIDAQEASIIARRVTGTDGALFTI
jgi:hypothetical protein